MRTLFYVCAVTVIATLSIGAAVRTEGPADLRSRVTELEQLHAALQAAKDAGQTADPAMLARARELEAALQSGIETAPPQTTPMQVSVAPQPAVHGIPVQVDPSQVPMAAVESPLEQQIHALENEVQRATASWSAQEEHIPVPQDLKDRLNGLYAQRPENQVPAHNPLDQGADICPGTFIPGLPYSDAGTTVGYANNYAPVTNCFTTTGNAPDVVYYFVAAYTGLHTVSLCGSSYDTYLYVVEGSCTLNQIACNDDYCNLQSQVSFNATAGLTYTIFVDGYNGASGSYVINVTDNCSEPCQGGDVAECAETPGINNASADCDGGCNNPSYGGVVSYQLINCGQTVCGVGFTYIGPGGLNFRDTDWFSFSLSQESNVSVTGVAEFPLQLYIFDGACTYTVLAAGTTPPCIPTTISAVALPAGNYVMWVGPGIFDGISTPRNFRATLQCVPTHCVTEQPGDIVECAETTDPGHLINDCSGGSCNTYYGGVASYLPIQCGQTYYARTFTYNNDQNRDTDWYQFTLAQAASVTVTVTADYFDPIISGFTQIGDCSFMEQYIVGTACTPSTMTSNGCLDPGTYYILITTNTTPLSTPTAYRLSMTCTPCCYDQALNAPGTVSGNTCGAGNDCSFNSSEDVTVRVNIPTASQWTFSLCSLDNIWDSIIYLTDACCGGTLLGFSDDDCGSYGLSKISCVTLAPGTYYLTIEGFASNGCGPYTLNVVECSGRCCYGDPANPSCTVTNPTGCAQLSGQYFQGETCANGCYVRPDCFANSLYGQQPFLPSELWNAYMSDANGLYHEADNFTGVTAPIGSIRFWGVAADASLVPCVEDPMQFDVVFYADAGGLPGAQMCTYTGTLTGTPTFVYASFGPAYQGREYQMGLNPPCNLSSGWVQVVASDPSTPNCRFYWMLSPQGDNLAAGYFTSPPWGQQPLNLAFCLGKPCMDPDSLVIKPVSPTVNRLFFKATVTGLYRVNWTTLADNSVPNNLQGQGFLTPGWWTVAISSAPFPYVRYMVNVDCSVDTAPPTLENQLDFQPVTTLEVKQQ